jgi:homoserine kinase
VKKKAKTSATAFAPATVANVAVGFDILGFPIEGPGDTVTVTRAREPGVRISKCEWICESENSSPLPLEPERNTATAGLVQLARELAPGFGFDVKIKKGIPLGSGMGGSAASAVAALVAANALLPKPLTKHQLLSYALVGESAASGARHADNAAPCLFGGLRLIRSSEPPDLVEVPVPAAVRCVLVHPRLRVETREARAILKREIPLADHVRQSANLAAFIAGCCEGDLALIHRSLRDVLIEPQRASLIKGFARAKDAAINAGALGFSISGSGPSVFAWCDSAASARTVARAVAASFEAAGVPSESWTSPILKQGARLLK